MEENRQFFSAKTEKTQVIPIIFTQKDFNKAAWSSFTNPSTGQLASVTHLHQIMSAQAHFLYLVSLHNIGQ